MNLTTNITRNNRLKRVYDFTEDDLQANLRGDVTSRQREQIARKRERHNQKKNIVLLVILGALGIAMLVLNGARRNYEDEDFSVIQNGIWVLIIFFVVMWVVATVRARRAKPILSSAQGPARTKIHEIFTPQTRSTFLYELNVGSYKFYVPTEEELSAFEDNISYRVHFVELTPQKIILSAEVLEPSGT